MTTMQGIRIEQVAAGTVIGGMTVADDQGVHDERANCVYVTAKNYEAIKASARDVGQVTYARRS